MFEASEPAPERLVEMARATEDAARAVPGITNSEGAEAGWNSSQVALAATNGFAHAWRTSSARIAVSVIASDAGGMERDDDWSYAVYLSDLRDAEEIGRNAGHRAVRRLGSRKPPTGRVPVIFDPRVSRGLLSHFSSAINGQSIARGTSFLKDALGKPVMPKGMNVIDDPHRRRGLRSSPCDSEGIANARRTIVEDGVLTTWLLDSRSARQLGMVSTGHASRGTSGPPSPSASNLWLAAGTMTPEELMADIKLGLYITEMMGGGVNGVTGDYSRGAAGFLIRDGKLAEPVAEITVAGHAIEMFANLTPANDLVFRRGTDSPTVRVEGMTMAGA
jgi:PmbA protein